MPNETGLHDHKQYVGRGWVRPSWGEKTKERTWKISRIFLTRCCVCQIYIYIYIYIYINYE